MIQAEVVEAVRPLFLTHLKLYINFTILGEDEEDIRRKFLQLICLEEIVKMLGRAMPTLRLVLNDVKVVYYDRRRMWYNRAPDTYESTRAWRILRDVDPEGTECGLDELDEDEVKDVSSRVFDEL